MSTQANPYYAQEFDELVGETILFAAAPANRYGDLTQLSLTTTGGKSLTVEAHATNAAELTLHDGAAHRYEDLGLNIEPEALVGRQITGHEPTRSEYYYILHFADGAVTFWAHDDFGEDSSLVFIDGLGLPDHFGR